MTKPIREISNPPLRWYGGKFMLASKIHALAARRPHTQRVYLFGGAGGEMWNWPHEGVAEIYNDLDGRLHNFFQVLRTPPMFDEFCRRAQATPFDEATFEEARELLDATDPVTAAWAMFTANRQSFSAFMRNYCPPGNAGRVRRGMHMHVSNWLSAVDGLAAAHQRAMRLAVYRRDAVDLIEQTDGPETLFYADPPYMAATRTEDNVYLHEYDDKQHVELLQSLAGIRGSFILSGYDSAVYRYYEQRERWHRQEIEHTVFVGAMKAGVNTKAKRLEVLWSNFNPETLP